MVRMSIKYIQDVEFLMLAHKKNYICATTAKASLEQLLFDNNLAGNSLLGAVDPRELVLHLQVRP
jgi:hypothetical protein